MIWKEGEEDGGAADCQDSGGRLCTVGQCAQHARDEMASETKAETETSRDSNTKAADDGCTVDTRERQRGLGQRMVSGNEWKERSNMSYSK